MTHCADCKPHIHRDHCYENRLAMILSCKLEGFVVELCAHHARVEELERENAELRSAITEFLAARPEFALSLTAMERHILRDCLRDNRGDARHEGT